MGNRAATYHSIAAILSAETPVAELETKLSASQFDWDALVTEGSKHLILPALYCQLKAKRLLAILPHDLETYLEQLTAINRNRNNSILAQIYEISKLLHSNGIDHTFLKGAALLASGYLADNAERMVGDIDILVPKNQIDQAFDIIRDNGYSETFGFAYDPKDHRHLDRLISPNKLAAIELHSELLKKNYRHLIDLNALMKTRMHKQSIAIPNRYFMCQHQILSWQINDHGYYYHRVNFKVVYDSLVLESNSGESILSHLEQNKFVAAYISISQYYCPEFRSISMACPSKKQLNLHKKYRDFFLYSRVLNLFKDSYLYISSRMRTFIFNASYRRHLLKSIFILKK